MKFLLSIAILAILLSTGCSKDLEIYISENTSKGIAFVYGKSFFFSSFKPRGWIIDNAVTRTNNLSLYLRPTNDTVRIIAYGILLTNNGASQTDMTDKNAESVYRTELARHPGLKMEKIVQTAPIDQSLQVQRYRYTSKKFNQESVYIIWPKTAVLLAVQSDNPLEFDYATQKLDIFISQIKYWGTDAGALSYRVIKAVFKK